MFIQRKKTPWKPGPDHDPSWDLTYWNDHDARWVDTKEEATGYHSKSGSKDLVRMLEQGNPGDAVTLEQ